jgi:hypothetical protein
VFDLGSKNEYEKKNKKVQITLLTVIAKQTRTGNCMRRNFGPRAFFFVPCSNLHRGRSISVPVFGPVNILQVKLLGEIRKICSRVPLQRPKPPSKLRISIITAPI